MWYALGISGCLVALMLGVVIWRFRLWKKIYRDHARIFISYRRCDTADVANHLRMFLEHSFRFQWVFLDTSSIQGGRDFPDAIREQIRESDTVFVLIGPRWEFEETDGDRRIMQEDDWVRQEVRAALGSRSHVVPVLVDDRNMPSGEDLPNDLKPLLRKAGARLRSGADFDATARVLEDRAAETGRPRGIARRLLFNDIALFAGLLAAFLAMVGWLVHREDQMNHVLSGQQEEIEERLSKVEATVDEKLTQHIPLKFEEIPRAVVQYGMDKALPTPVIGYTLDAAAVVKKVDAANRRIQIGPVEALNPELPEIVLVLEAEEDQLEKLEQGSKVRLRCRLTTKTLTSNKIYLSGKLLYAYPLGD